MIKDVLLKKGLFFFSKITYCSSYLMKLEIVQIQLQKSLNSNEKSLTIVTYCYMILHMIIYYIII